MPIWQKHQSAKPARLRFNFALGFAVFCISLSALGALSPLAPLRGEGLRG